MSSLIYYVTSVKKFFNKFYILLQVLIVYYNLYSGALAREARVRSTMGK